MDPSNPFTLPDKQRDEQQDEEEPPGVLAERRIADAGQSQAMYNYSQKLLEQKEKELMESIAMNYGRIRDVERELGNLQLQLKLTSGPKKHALELLRKKIETQNEKVVYVRNRHAAAKTTYERLDAELKQEEAIKDRLCTELNTLVQEAARAQLNKLEELKATLEGLYSGVMPKQQQQQQQQQQGGPSSVASSVLPPAQQQQQQQQPAESAAVGPTGAAGGDVAGQPAVKPCEEQQRQRQEQEERKRQEAEAAERRRRAAEAEAAAARSRHVSLPLTAAPNGSGSNSPRPGAGPGAVPGRPASGAPASGQAPGRRAGAPAGAGSPEPKAQSANEAPKGSRGPANGGRFAGFDT